MDGSMSLNAIVSQQSQTISARLDLVTSAINSAEQVESEMEFICFNYLSLEGLTRLVDAFASVNIPGAHERFQMHSLGERFYINISREDATSLIDLFNQTNYPIFTSLSQRVVATLFILPAEPRASSADGGSCGAKGPRMKLLRTDPDEIDPPPFNFVR